MAKLTIERSPTVVLNTELDDSVCDRLWDFEKKYWRGKRESSVESWQVLIEEIFDSYLKNKGC